MAYYAWSNIQDKEGKQVKPGDSVDAGKLGIDKEEFDALVESGAVREEKYPEEALEGNLSPSEIAKRDLAIAAGQIEATDVEGAGVKESTKGKASE